MLYYALQYVYVCKCAGERVCTLLSVL